MKHTLKFQYEGQDLEALPIPGTHMKYFATKCGRIFRCTEKGIRENKQSINNDGYLRTSLNNRAKAIHRLICLAFHGQPPTDNHEVAHNDGNPTNNHADNLRWATRSQNQHDAINHRTASCIAINQKRKHAAFKRLEEYARKGYLPLRTEKKPNEKRVRIWLALRRKLEREQANK